MSLWDKLIGKPQPPQSSPSASCASPAQVLYEKGMRLLEAGQKREALHAWVDAVEADPRCIDACIMLARSFHQIDPVEYGELMLKYAEQAYEIDPSNSRAANIASVARFARGKTHWDHEEWQDAYECFKLSLIYDPENQQPFAALEYHSKRANQRIDFADFCERLLRTSPGHNERNYALGRACLDIAISISDTPTLGPIRSEWLTKGRAALSEYLRGSPECPDGWYAFGHTCNLMKDKDAATKACATLAGLDPDRAQELSYAVLEF